MALVDDDVPCAEVFARMETDGETQSAYCAELPAYRAEVSDLVLGETVDSYGPPGVDGLFAIIRVRVDFHDRRPSIPDSEIEVNVVDGRPRVALGMP